MHRIGTVSFLNAKPLVDGLDRCEDVEIVPAVPSRLLEFLLAGRVDVALCPTIDFQRAPQRLRIVPAGGIASAGETLTVRVFSRVPLEDVQTVRVDPDSHTSVALMEIIFAERFGHRPRIQPMISEVGDELATREAVLLIGDKVVTTEPDPDVYPHQLDLGAAWREFSGLPFVFAIWMARPGETLGDLPARLGGLRRENEGRIEEIVQSYARPLGWPPELARRYLGTLLRYRIGRDELESMQRFWSLCAAHGVISNVRTIAVHE